MTRTRRRIAGTTNEPGRWANKNRQREQDVSGDSTALIGASELRQRVELRDLADERRSGSPNQLPDMDFKLLRRLGKKF